MIKLKPSEVRFWQDVYLRVRGVEGRSYTDCAFAADRAVVALRERLEEPGPPPDAGRL